ncbi:polysaccharide biosynthesis/export family protein [Sedimentimonas flavescens]|uniref:Polysaccharide biosynthesis/export family protein n=1 Tax=Sedimentimonas flavescens TaxID=2851012 RepID=A0ABT2ZVB5_9RHOB|nr:polysaccharide biosynthesis/export family protein [Sedimentimonas flavescens]MCV2877684.1 polysaccharide biosynthesis/export family protein [Sedimentimonas flavescens]
MRKTLTLMFVVAALAGCTEGHVNFPVTDDGQKSLPANVEVIRLSSANITSYTEPEHVPGSDVVPGSQAWTYRVGVGDVLSIDVFDHPELTLPVGPARSAVDAGFRVQADGTFHYPFVGSVTAQGRAPEKIREDLREKLSTYIPNPQLEVRVAAFNSQSVIVSGEVKQPNRQALTTSPLTLLEAVNAAGGMTSSADASRIKLRRDNRTYNINLERFLGGNASKTNVVLRAGDVVSVPRRQLEEAYILGQVVKPATIDLSLDPVSITQALTRQGGLQEQRADARGVFVFRKNGERIKVFQLEADSPTGLVLGTEFLLAPNDVIYVTRSPIGKWNDTITRILPSISVAGSVNDFEN